MSEIPRFPLMSAFGGRVEIGPITIDEIAEVRALERRSFLHFHNTRTTEPELEAFLATLGSEQHMDSLLASINSDALYGARLDRRLIGVVGWSFQGGSQAKTARINLLYVDHLFSSNGVGRSLLQLFETSAGRAGASALAARTLVSSAGFFERHGYEITSYGSHNLSERESLSIAYLRKLI